MLYKNLTVKELYTSISDPDDIYHFFVRGLKMDNERLAVSAMEELIVRGDTDMVARGLWEAFERGDIKVKSTTATMIARSLSESCRGVDPFLHKFGKFLFKAEGPNPFREFIERASGEAFFSKCSEGQKLSLKSDIQKSAEFDDTDAMLRRFGKYLNLENSAQNIDSDDLHCQLSKYLHNEDSKRKLRDLLKVRAERAKFEELLGDEESLKGYLYRRIGDYRL